MKACVFRSACRSGLLYAVAFEAVVDAGLQLPTMIRLLYLCRVVYGISTSLSKLICPLKVLFSHLLLTSQLSTPWMGLGCSTSQFSWFSIFDFYLSWSWHKSKQWPSQMPPLMHQSWTGVPVAPASPRRAQPALGQGAHYHLPVSWPQIPLFWEVQCFYQPSLIFLCWSCQEATDKDIFFFFSWVKEVNLL